MVIELKSADNPEWKPKLTINKLSAGDYCVLSVEKMHKEITGGQYGSSYMCFVDVFEFSYFDIAARKVVDKKFPTSEKASTFFNATLWDKISKVGVNKLVKIEAVQTKAGKVTYDVKEHVVGSSNSTSNDGELYDIHVNEDGTMITDIEKLSILKSINSFRESNFTDEQIIQFLSPKCPVESLKELMQLK